MPIPSIWLIAALAVIAVVFIVLLLLPGQDKQAGTQPDVSVSAAPGSVVTVRKVGHVTSVLIREAVHDHWEGGDGISLPLLPTELTRRDQPGLFAEYMSPDTRPSRKYQIIDEVYALGYTLPFLPGLYDQYKKEVEEAIGKDKEPTQVCPKSPVNLTPSHDKPQDGVKRMDIDDGLRHAPLPDMGSGDEPADNQ